MHDENDEESTTSVSLYTAPSGLVPPGTKFTAKNLGELGRKITEIDTITFYGSEIIKAFDLMRASRAFQPLIPPMPEQGGIGAATLTREQAAKARDALHAGPWAMAYPWLADQFSPLLGQALEAEDTLILVAWA